MEHLDAYLILGCNGFTNKTGFIHCAGISNPVLDLSDITNPGTYERVVAFLENARNLFDSPMYNYNKCCNVLTMLYRDYGVIEEDILLDIQSFLKAHRQCGVYIILMMKEDFDNE